MGTPTCAHIVLLLAPSILCCGGRRKEKQNVDFTGQDSVMRFQATCSKEGTGGRIADEPDGAGQRWGARAVRRRGFAQRSSASLVWVAPGPRPRRFLPVLGI